MKAERRFHNQFRVDDANENKLRIIDMMEEKPPIRIQQVAERLGYSRTTLGRWMQNPNDAQAELIMRAVIDIRCEQERAADEQAA